MLSQWFFLMAAIFTLQMMSPQTSQRLLLSPSCATCPGAGAGGSIGEAVWPPTASNSTTRLGILSQQHD